MSHIQINYAFLLFWSILGEIHRKNLFLVKKVTFSERSIEKLRNLFNLIFLKRVNPEENMDLFKQLFLIKPVKGDNIKKKVFFSPQSEPPRAKLCFSVVLKHFGRNSERSSLFSQNRGYLRKEHWNTQKFCFSKHVWKGTNPEENLDLFKQLFLIKVVKWEYIKKNLFFSSKWATYRQIMLVCCFEVFWEKFRVNFSFFWKKSDFSERSTEILRKFVILTHLKR